MTNETDPSRGQHDLSTTSSAPAGTRPDPGPQLVRRPDPSSGGQLQREWGDPNEPADSRPTLERVQILDAETRNLDAKTRHIDAETRSGQRKHRGRVEIIAVVVWALAALVWLGFVVTDRNTTTISTAAMFVTNGALAVLAGSKNGGDKGDESK